MPQERCKRLSMYHAKTCKDYGDSLQWNQMEVWINKTETHYRYGIRKLQWWKSFHQRDLQYAGGPTGPLLWDSSPSN